VFLDVAPSSVGIIGGGSKKLTGIIDIGIFQSLYHKDEVNDIVADYGQVIVDECHRVAAFSFEKVLKQVKARFVLGLTATLIRKDGRHPIIMMQCGPARFRVRPKKEAKSRPFAHVVIPRYTDFTIRTNLETMSFHEIYALLIEDYKRNEIILDDITEACRNGRSPLLLTERVSHLMYLADELNRRIKNVIILKGGMGRKQRQELAERLSSHTRF
jgi:superfamily II DNA or RNA helicase